MKNLSLLFVAIASLTISSCSTDDIVQDNSQDNTLNTNIKVLKKTIIYTPSIENFETKRIQYYDTVGELSADSTFNGANELMSYQTQTSQGNNIVIKKFDSNNLLLSSITNEYDSLKRLTKTDRFPTSSTFTYNSDNTISRRILGHDQITNTYSLNGAGYIDRNFRNSANTASFLQYVNNRPIALGYDGILSSFFEFYTVPMPSNLIKTPTEINNIALLFNDLQYIPQNCNFYLKELFDVRKYETEFDALNYRTHSIVTMIASEFQEPSSETFFYYY